MKLALYRECVSLSEFFKTYWLKSKVSLGKLSNWVRYFLISLAFIENFVFLYLILLNNRNILTLIWNRRKVYPRKGTWDWSPTSNYFPHRLDKKSKQENIRVAFQSLILLRRNILTQRRRNFPKNIQEIINLKILSYIVGEARLFIIAESFHFINLRKEIEYPE